MYKKIILILLISLDLFAAQTFKELKFEGLTQISDEVARETVNLKGNQYTIKDTNKIINEFYKFNYFKDIWITDNNNTLTIHFKEKPFIAKLEMTGYKNRDDELKTLYSSMDIKKGMMYTKLKIKRAKKALLLALSREGYINSVVEVEVKNINDTSVSVKFSVNKGDPITITNITYKGAKALNSNDFESVIANKETDCCFTWFYGQNDGKMSFEQLPYDSRRIQDLYLQKGYMDAKVTAAYSKVDFNTNTATIEYTIVEGKQYKVNNTIIYLDESILDVKTLYPKLKLKKEDIFNISKLRKDQEYIQTKVANKGYAFAKVNFDIKQNKDKNTVDIIYNVIPGDKVYINDVIISGNNRTLDRVIRRNIYLAHEDLFNLTDFKDSKSSLKRTGFFETVDIKQKRVSSDKMDLLVNVSEAATGNLIFGGGYGSYDGWMINASVNDKNIFGSGMKLGFSVDYSSKSTSYTLSLSNPAINDSKYDGNINIYKKDNTIVSNNLRTGDSITKEKGFDLGVGRSLSRHTRIGTDYSYNITDVSYENNSSLDYRFTTSSITPYINFNNTDDYFTPRSGITTGSSLKYAGIGGDAKYIQSSSYFKYYHSLEDMIGSDIILRYKNNLKITIDNGNLPNETTFYLGGPSSLRGYSSYAFQPENENNPFKKYFTNTMELSFPLIPSAKMRWSIFYDYGMIGENSFTKIKRSSDGIVISWYSPVGPLQFIFANAINPEPEDKTSNFEFSLGTKF